MDRRLFALLVVGVAGCQTAQRAYDPFLGRTTVPPPGTMAPMQVQPYYGGSAPANLSAPAITAPITPGVPATPPVNHGQPSSTPPGGYQYLPGARRPIGGTKLSQQAQPNDEGATAIDFDAMIAAQKNQPVSDSAVQPVSWNEETDTTKTSSQAQRTSEAPIRIVEPTIPDSSSANTAQSESRDASGLSIPATPIRELADLPRVKSVAEGKTVAPTTTADNQKSRSNPVSLRAEESQTSRSSVNPNGVAPSNPVSTSSRNRARESYDYDAKYNWLKGQLEYSQSKQIWKLRYIPLDGTTDDFGGSVVLSAGAHLDSYKPGEFVTVYGQVGPQQTSARSYAPLYQLSRIERQ